MDPWAAYYGAYAQPGYPMAYPPHAGYAYPPPMSALPPSGGGDRGRNRSRSRSPPRGKKNKGGASDDKGFRDLDVHTPLQLQMKKTRICNFWQEGKCKRGDKCTFAHGDVDKAQAPDLRKTSLCQKYMRRQCHLSSEQCNFAHGEDEVRHIGVCYKTKMCLSWQKGNCNQGKHCKFAHGEDELKELPSNIKLAPPIQKPPKEPDRTPLKISYEDVESSSASSSSRSRSRRRSRSRSRSRSRGSSSARSGKSRRRRRPRRDYGPGKWTRRLCQFCCTTVATRFEHEACAVCRQSSLIDDNYQPDFPEGLPGQPPAPSAAPAAAAVMDSTAKAAESAGGKAAASAEAPKSPVGGSPEKEKDTDKEDRKRRSKSRGGSSDADSLDAQL
eukprot:TRINITY_DN24076_c0_g1_i1.p1 TRINITY_DN24076_c0_g1~~TRINITY_DN24076_c0_g1_i1.p1  ORF type:complete len:385 (+),score=69.69 TRINITY_DN24076_c0_g1_i1:88-1242(+)